MGRPTLTFPNELPESVRRELEALMAQLTDHDTVPVPFEQANFEARSGMVWTIDPNRVTFYFRRLGPTRLFVALLMTGVSVSGTRNEVFRVRVPDGRLIALSTAIAGTGQDAGTGISLRVSAAAGEQWIEVRRDDLANWAAATTNTTVAFQIEVEVLPQPR